MPGRIMSAQQAVSEYGKKYKSLKKTGNSVGMKNSQGKKISVPKNTRVYHRGNGCFAVYSEKRDKKRSAKGANQRFGKTKYLVGTGPYRHTRDS